MLLLEIEPRHLEPVEFIVSGSLTGANNTLEQYSSGGTSNLTTKTRTITSKENTGYNGTRNTGSDQSYAPYFIVSLHDETVREGESIFFGVAVSGN